MALPSISPFVRAGDVDALAAAIASKKYNLDAPDEDGYTPLYLASMKASGATMASHLLAARAVVDAKGSDKETPLFIAAFNENVAGLRTLLKASPAPNLNEVNGVDKDTALHAAARFGYVQIVQELVDAGANINFRNAKLETPLFQACRAGKLETVFLLLKLGANKVLANQDTKDPLYIASEKGHAGIVELLKADKQHLAFVKSSVMSDIKNKPPMIQSTEALVQKASAAAASATEDEPQVVDPAPKATTATGTSAAPLKRRDPSPSTAKSTAAASVAARTASPAAKQASPAPPPKAQPASDVVKYETTPVIPIQVVEPAPRTHDPFTGKKLDPCKTLVEAGVYVAPPVPKDAVKEIPEMKARYGGTMMMVGTGAEEEGPVRQRPLFTPETGDVFSTVILPPERPQGSAARR